jgi:hypothetical protein
MKRMVSFSFPGRVDIMKGKKGSAEKVTKFVACLTVENRLNFFVKIPVIILYATSNTGMST